jgi:hypothetical protein
LWGFFQPQISKKKKKKTNPQKSKEIKIQGKQRKTNARRRNGGRSKIKSRGGQRDSGHSKNSPA